MLLKKFITLLIFFLTILKPNECFIEKNTCNIDITTLQPQPLILTNNGGNFLYPEPGAKELSLITGDIINIYCPGSNIQIGTKKYPNALNATCKSGIKFTSNLDGKEITFSQIQCTKEVTHIARMTGKSCSGGGKEVEIGFALSEIKFLRLIRLCFDQKTQNTMYSQFNLTASIGSYQRYVPRPNFFQDDFYDTGKDSINYLYTQKKQKVTINKLLALPEDSDEYIKPASDFYLARGHLTARADFFYGTQQNATFHFVNVAPQWQSFNGKNWEQIEFSVRKYADKNQVNLQVTTGTLDVTTLPHSNTGEEVQLYLYTDEEADRKGIPVPYFYWKVVVEPKSKKGVVLIGVNNPYINNPKELCKNVSEEIKWIDWTISNQKEGFIHACTVQDFRKVVKFLPPLGTIKDLLR